MGSVPRSLRSFRLKITRVSRSGCLYWFCVNRIATPALWVAEATASTVSTDALAKRSATSRGTRMPRCTVAGTPGTVHRGIRVPREVAERLANASVLTVDAVASATHNAGVAIRFTQNQYRHPERDTRVIFNLKLRSERGTLPIDSFSAHQGEHEILVGAGKRFKV